MRKPRQAVMLSSLADDKFFPRIAEGISLLIENAQKYFQDAQLLAAHAPGRAVEHLRLAAEEEAAKVLILLDAVRCPRQRRFQESRARTLKYFTKHRACGAYAWYACNRPGTFAEASEIIQAALQDHYYDGPDDEEFECRNWIEARREETLYVDYIEDDGNCYWASPKEFYEVGRHVGHSMVLDLTESLWRLGCGTSDGIRIIADVWRPIEVSDSTAPYLNWPEYGQHNIRTLEQLTNAGLTHGAQDTDWNVVFDTWNYPLYSLDFEQLKKGGSASTGENAIDIDLAGDALGD